MEGEDEAGVAGKELGCESCALSHLNPSEHAAPQNGWRDAAKHAVGHLLYASHRKSRPYVRCTASAQGTTDEGGNGRCLPAACARIQNDFVASLAREMTR
jgi:hypothetical protein